ncbi:hypothetical protein Zmor_007973 [Zophobas morio]|uniref:Uncharacterized protein n=1 Tax=Zophobas morio TaxID=2755281 RepID=A0AA38J0D3_9CUCU|nr:hypothetical protein Zmor_007973 [Zophobas morio]
MPPPQKNYPATEILAEVHALFQLQVFSLSRRQGSIFFSTRPLPFHPMIAYVDKEHRAVYRAQTSSIHHKISNSESGIANESPTQNRSYASHRIALEHPHTSSATTKTKHSAISFYTKCIYLEFEGGREIADEQVLTGCRPLTPAQQRIATTLLSVPGQRPLRNKPHIKCSN